MQAEPQECYPAALYHAVHRGNDGDVAFYRAACAGSEAVLELGCGNGRVATALGAGIALVAGFDRDLDALRMASARGLMCFAADMRTFALARRFDRIIVPYNGLYCLLDDDALGACLRTVRDHLEDAGQLIFDGYAVDGIDQRHATAPLSTPPEQVATVECDARRWDVYEQTVIWPATRRVDATYAHLPHDGSAEVSATIRQRYLDAAELHELLGDAGLCLLSLHGGFNGERYDAASEHLVVRAGRM